MAGPEEPCGVSRRHAAFNNAAPERLDHVCLPSCTSDETFKHAVSYN